MSARVNFEFHASEKVVLNFHFQVPKSENRNGFRKTCHFIIFLVRTTRAGEAHPFLAHAACAVRQCEQPRRTFFILRVNFIRQTIKTYSGRFSICNYMAIVQLIIDLFVGEHHQVRAPVAMI